MTAVGCGPIEPASDTPNPKLDVHVAFLALWWSEDQMEGFDPNHPPAKKTPTFIEQWEYSDPIGVPHPDRVEVVAIVGYTGSGVPLAVEIRSKERWKVGPFGDEESGEWSAFEGLPTPAPVTLEAGKDIRIRLTTVEIRALQTTLQDRGQWPWSYEIAVQVVTANGTASHLAQVTAGLPIFPGD